MLTQGFCELNMEDPTDGPLLCALAYNWLSSRQSHRPFFLSVKSSVILFVLEIDHLSKSHRVHLQPR